jgi:hypothetical protein
MPPRQVSQQQCGCIDEIWSNTHFTVLCNQHLVIVNSRGSTPPSNMNTQQGQIPTTIGGTPFHPFAQFQMGGFGPPFQMPPQGVRVQMQQQGTGR